VKWRRRQTRSRESLLRLVFCAEKGLSRDAPFSYSVIDGGSDVGRQVAKVAKIATRSSRERMVLRDGMSSNCISSCGPKAWDIGGIEKPNL
jgi:hypothetical protein